ncbi:36592_t:CDS:2 [Gigaspora margarita]|uniref:36592_t:CDS:1 n=1 Tax=Gigaspora margarita TaxID=4874 RepID=A0ABN7VXG0_GIGMA|nr:36592_t:CDS:2 [Gigaspora margarita]
MVKVEEKQGSVKMLGVWVSESLKKMQVTQKASNIIGYINQTLKITKLMQKALDKLYQPIIRLVKQKLRIAQTVSNLLITHRNLSRCKKLSYEILTQQITSAQYHLNSQNTSRNIARLRIKQGYALAGIVTEDWKIINNKNAFGPTIKEMLDNRMFTNSCSGIQKLGLFYVNQFLSKNHESMIAWSTLKVLKTGQCKGKKPLWFKELEKKLLSNQGNRKIKEMYKVNRENKLALCGFVEQISRDNCKQEWVLVNKKDKKEEGNLLFTRCQGCSISKTIGLKRCWPKTKSKNIAGVILAIKKNKDKAAASFTREIIHTHLSKDKSMHNSNEIELIDILPIEQTGTSSKLCQTWCKKERMSLIRNFSGVKETYATVHKEKFDERSDSYSNRVKVRKDHSGQERKNTNSQNAALHCREWFYDFI